ncbi:glyoxalase superfamily protein [Hymenobacter convexus]|uniref:glyoxalase superfamily protein n=1 Tax=Hymenobacter sp. CA1UV-4 TaxID=3063782 RepID=UPI0027143C53|nr:glyoxalase superfamily protein [Hymenobacter sp. CA1UV-4]MDO7850450.1 glyoxalase superfamily protein [Hymenobacter sp. CA1UV-4]
MFLHAYMVTPVFTISDYAKAIDFYINWLGFRIDWEEVRDKKPVYVQVSRREVILHLNALPDDVPAGAKARAEMQGLLAFHRQLLSKNLPLHPTLQPAYWSDRVLEMEVTDPFGNRIVFCEFATLPA